jgi:transposase
MTTSPYSIDLRKKVIDYINKGNSQKEAGEIFAIHKNTINRWWLRYKSEGNLTPKKRLGLKSKVDKSKLEEFVRNNPDTTLSAVGIKFGITAGQVGVILKKLGFSYKKKPIATWRQMRKKGLSTSKL